MSPSSTEVRRVIRVYFVDDHPLVRRSLIDLIQDEKDLQMCGEASSCAEAMMAMAKARPDVVVADISLGERSGLDLIREMKETHPTVSILVLSMHDEASLAQRALRAGALGYVMKSEEPERVLEGIRAVAQGRIFVSEAQNNRMLSAVVHGGENAFLPSACLSDRELEVYELYGQGCRTSEVADRLKVSAKTVETYRKRIKGKLKLRHSGDLLRSAMSWVERENRT